MKAESLQKLQSDVYERLVETIAENDSIAMVGAGSSRRVGYPDWNELLNLLSAQAAKVEPSQIKNLKSLQKADPLVCADRIKEILGPEVFYYQLKEIFGPDKPKHDEFHELLVQLPFSHFLTTNYDRILQVANESFKKVPYTELDLGDSKTSDCLYDSISSKKAQRHFMHVHGSVRKPRNIILALEDYNERYVKRNELTELLKQVFTRRIVFVGFSLKDEEFMGPLKFLTACLGRGEPRHFAILAKPNNDEEISTLSEIYKSKYRIEPFFYDPRDGHAVLIPFLRELKEHIKKRQSELFSEGFKNLEGLAKQEPETADMYQGLQDIIIPTISSSHDDTSLPDLTTRTNLDSEIDKIFLHVKGRHPEIAIEMYKSILEREGDSLDRRLKYRLHANIGNALNSMNRQKDAAKEYLGATDFWDETKDSHAIRALGHVLNGDYEKALVIVNRTCTEHPDYPRAYALRLQCLHNKYSLKEARKSVPPKLRRDPEVAYALSVIANEQGLRKRHEVYSKIAWKSSPDWIEAGLTCATAILLDEKDKAIISGGTKFIPRNRDRVKEAESIFTNLLSKLQHSDPANRKGIILYNRATTRRLLGLESEARSDIEEAFHHDKNNPEIIGAYALQRELDAGCDEAIRIFEEHGKTLNHPTLSFLLSHLLFKRSNQGDLERALSIMMPLCEGIKNVTPATHRFDFLMLTSFLLCKFERSEEAIGIIQNIPESTLPSSQKQLLVLRIKIELKTIDIEEAKQSVEELAEALGINDYMIAREIALCADKIKHYSLSFTLWKKITTPQDYNQDTEHLLNAAKNTKGYDYILDFCEQLRLNDIHERNCYVYEIEANMECHEFNEVISLMVKWIALNPDDKEMRMNLSLLASDVGKDDYIESEPDKLPTIEEVPDATYGARVVETLNRSGHAQVAIVFAYQLWRKFPDDMNARHTLISTILISNPDEIILTKPTTVEIDCAVVYKATDSKELRIHIIEDGPSPSIARNEYSPNQEISKLLLGRNEKDTILINEREFTILAINNKYSYVASSLLKDFDIEFPGNTLFRKFQTPIKDDSSIDPQEALGEVRAYMQDEETRKKTFEELYQKRSIPVSTFAKCVGKSVLETMMYVAASPGRKIQVCPGIADLGIMALKQLSKGCKIVLDETAIATIFMLGIYKNLQQLPYDLIIPETLICEIRQLIRQAVSKKRSNLLLGISDGKLVTQKVSPTQHATWINSLEELLVSLNDNCAIEGGKALLDIEVNARGNLIKNLGSANADAIAIAKQSGAVYWTDDLMSHVLASEWKMQHVWSQIALQYVKKIDRSFIGEYNKAEKDLFLWGYDFTFVQMHTIISIYIDTKWNVEDFRVKHIEEFIGRVGAVNKRNCMTTCLIILSIWKKCSKRKNACELIIRLLEKMGRDISGPNIARVIYKGQHKIFSSRRHKIRSLKRMLRSWRMNSFKMQ